MQTIYKAMIDSTIVDDSRATLQSDGSYQAPFLKAIRDKLSTCPDCGGFGLVDGTMPTGESIYCCTVCENSFYTIDPRPASL